MECLKSITLANGVCVQQQCRTMNILIKYHWIYSLQATKCKWLLLEKRPKLHSFLSKPPEIQMQLLFMTLQILRFVTHHQSYRAATHLVISLYPSIKYLNMMEAFNRVASILHLKIPWAFCFTVSWMVVDFTEQFSIKMMSKVKKCNAIYRNANSKCFMRLVEKSQQLCIVTNLQNTPEPKLLYFWAYQLA